MSSRNVDSLLSELDGMLDDGKEDMSYEEGKISNEYSEDADIDSLLRATDVSSSRKTQSNTSSRVTKKTSSTSLICLNCDFEVLKFDTMTWSVSANYLFFRNYVPDKCALSKKLEPSERHVSYCCQCAWQTLSTHDKHVVSERSGTADGRDVRWVGSSGGESWKTLL